MCTGKRAAFRPTRIWVAIPSADEIEEDELPVDEEEVDDDGSDESRRLEEEGRSKINENGNAFASEKSHPALRNRRAASDERSMPFVLLFLFGFGVIL